MLILSFIHNSTDIPLFSFCLSLFSKACLLILPPFCPPFPFPSYVLCFSLSLSPLPCSPYAVCYTFCCASCLFCAKGDGMQLRDGIVRGNDCLMFVWPPGLFTSRFSSTEVGKVSRIQYSTCVASSVNVTYASASLKSVHQGCALDPFLVHSKFQCVLQALVYKLLYPISFL